MIALLTADIMSPHYIFFRDCRGRIVYRLWVHDVPQGDCVAYLTASRWAYTRHLTRMGTAYGVPHQPVMHEKYGWLLDMAREAGMEFPGEEESANPENPSLHD